MISSISASYSCEKSGRGRRPSCGRARSGSLQPLGVWGLDPTARLQSQITTLSGRAPRTCVISEE